MIGGLFVVNYGLYGDVPVSVLKDCLAVTVGDDACHAARHLYAVAGAGICEVLGRHHQRELVNVAVVDDAERPVCAVVGVEHKD